MNCCVRISWLVAAHPVLLPRRHLTVAGLRVRHQYDPPPAESLRWFPGHMRTGWHQMEAKLRAVDAVIEVHDARVPFSGRNARFEQALAARPRLLVLNKADLVTKEDQRRVAARMARDGAGDAPVFACCRDQADAGLRSLARRLSAVITGSERAARADPREFNCMVVGVPNVGKSSLINALRGLHLRRAAAAAVGPRAGVTRSVTTRVKVSERPLIYVRDTPGVLEPRLSPPEAGLRLALCAALQDHLVGPHLLADYLLYWLNRRGNHAYVSHMAVAAPTDDVARLLAESAAARGRFQRVRDVARGAVVRRPDTHGAALHMVRGFRAGVLGQILLDDDLLEEPAGEAAGRL
ncbi:mitochondrial GTPase 1-like [Pollicipes pollicipes]|uniref:mitochondrial GTPase 1-like n=1 Tax=Pollicipes pollicipes TaxID=41117 RepID=UPI0018851177|nr:mitochondrial GTPase 1-like [Pollicipes pollicipes]XP_037078204.1 mitochondrial GTPase 1-like [Pollicipes pollicipes]XP_037078205.1 mitochondrial GTPase 1-like [Pollicipes pollicipes]